MSRLLWGLGFLATITVGFRLLIAGIDHIAHRRQATTVTCTCGWTNTRRSAARAAQDYVDHRDIFHGTRFFDWEEEAS